MEISHTKYPPAGSLPKFWEDNKEALIQYMEQALIGAFVCVFLKVI